jgi:peptidoglycan/xylan/chitin deacetylase (PgdA/CDA1 family)
MKRFFTAAASVALLLAGCRTGQTQSQNAQPQVVAVPPDELSREPSLSPATTNAGPAAVASSATSPQTSAPVSTAPGTPPKRLSYNSCNVDGPYIAITFDDGPHAELTPKLLDMLKARGVKATFFMVGQCVIQYPQIVKRMVAEGHEVANHSWSHPALTKLGADGVRKQLVNTSDAIENASGVRPTVMRPPYGATNAALNKKINDDYGMKVVLWSVDPLDWKYRNASRVSSEIIKATQPGGIILAHDIHPTTVAAMPATIDALLAKGYKFVTVSELIAMDRPAPVKAPEPASTPMTETAPAPTP